VSPMYFLHFVVLFPKCLKTSSKEAALSCSFLLTQDLFASSSSASRNFHVPELSKFSKLIKPSLSLSLSLSLVFLVSPGYLLVCIICFLILSPFPFLCRQYLLCIVELHSMHLRLLRLGIKVFAYRFPSVSKFVQFPFLA